MEPCMRRPDTEKILKLSSSFQTVEHPPPMSQSLCTSLVHDGGRESTSSLSHLFATVENDTKPEDATVGKGGMSVCTEGHSQQFTVKCSHIFVLVASVQPYMRE